MRIVPSMIKLCQMLLHSGRKIDYAALRLVELGARLSKVMMAAEINRSLNSDPCLKMFRTFGEVNDLPTKALITITGQEQFALDIVDAAKTFKRSLVILPIDPSSLGYPKGWAHQTIKWL